MAEPGGGPLAQVTAGNGLGKTYQHDDFGRIVNLGTVNRGTLRFGYDASGNLLRRWDDYAATRCARSRGPWRCRS